MVGSRGGVVKKVVESRRLGLGVIGSRGRGHGI